MTKILKEQKILIAIIFILVLVIFCLFTFTESVAYASTTSGSNVLDDLSVDDKFAITNYPSNQEDYSLQIINIAESTEGELLIYVYQPATNKDYRATEISLSPTDELDPEYSLYELQYQNNYETIYKYCVKGFTVSNSVVRYYSISEIFREFDSSVDIGGEVSNGGSTSYKAFRVAKLWEFGEVNGNDYVTCDDLIVEVIDQTMTGLVTGRDINLADEYANGILNSAGMTNVSSYDVHFIAFKSSDFFDKATLQRAKVDFYTIYEHNEGKTTISSGGMEWTVSNPNPAEHHEVWLDANNHYTLDNDINLFNQQEVTFSEIQTPEDFINTWDTDIQYIYNGVLVKVGADQNIYDDAKDKLNTMSWVLNICITGRRYVTSNMGLYQDEYYTRCYDEAIIQLEYYMDGVVYNVGVVSNKTNEDPNAINYTERIVELTELGQWILLILGIVLLVLLCVFVLPPLLKIISAPFKLIRWIFKGKKTQKVEIVNVPQDTYGKKKKKYKYRR